MQTVAQANLRVASSLRLEMPTLWSEGEGRRQWDRITESSRCISRGSRDGMHRKKDNAEREARCSGRVELPTRSYKTSVEKGPGLSRDSEGFIVPFEDQGQHNPIRGKGSYFVHATNEWRIRRLR